jgi:hypothetical protein
MYRCYPSVYKQSDKIAIIHTDGDRVNYKEVRDKNNEGMQCW